MLPVHETEVIPLEGVGKQIMSMSRKLWVWFLYCLDANNALDSSRVGSVQVASVTPSSALQSFVPGADQIPPRFPLVLFYKLKYR
jgi:hypothetical protein